MVGRIRWLVENVANLVRRSIPWIRRLARLIWVMVATSVAVWWLGVPEARRIIAEDWRDRAFRWGIPTEHGNTVFQITRWVALFVMIIFYIITAELVVMALRIIF